MSPQTCLVRVAAILLLLAPWAAAQEEPPTPIPPARKAEAEAQLKLAKGVQQLDGLLDQLRATQQASRETLQQVEAAVLLLQDTALAPTTAVAKQLAAQLRALNQQATDQLQALLALRAKAIAEVPELPRDPLQAIREQLVAIRRLPELVDAEKQIAKIEEQLLSDSFKNEPGTPAMLTWTRYRHADVLRQRAVAQLAGATDHRASEKILLRASGRFAEVLTTPDLATDEEGTSLHAAALHRIVQVETSLFEAYKRLNEARPTQTHADRERKHKKAVEEAFAKLRRLHPEARLADGRLVVDVARQDAYSLR